MRAIIIAGGFGSRLQPLTARHPKHVLPVAGVPLLFHQLSKLADADVTDVVVAASYRADQLDPVVSAAKELGLTVRIATEETPLGTGGAIRNAAAVLDAGPNEPIIVLNGDQLSGHSIGLQVDEFSAAHADVSLQLVRVPDARPYGCVPTDDRGRVLEFCEKSPDPVTNQINAGCYVFRRSVIDAIPQGTAISVERETFPALLRSDAVVVGHVDDRYWIDVGTPDALVRASKDLVTGVMRTPAYRHAPSQRCVDSGASVDAMAIVRGGSMIGTGARVEAGARVEGSLLMPGATVRQGATVIDSVLGPDACIGERTSLREAAIGDDASIGADCELAHGARVSCATTIPDRAVRYT